VSISIQDDHQQKSIKLAQELSNEQAEGTDPSSGSRRHGNSSNLFVCQICDIEQVNRVLLPCRHAKMCAQCTDRIIADQGKCPFCRKTITDAEVIYT